jgi:SAM-dependent methyltransferase
MPKFLHHLRHPETLPALLWKNVKHPFVQYARRRERPRDTVPVAFFDATYQQNPDPWNGAAIEEADCPSDIAALPAQHFASGFEVGCSIGVKTRFLAARCDRLLASDFAEAALVQARQRCADLPHVSFERMQIPRDWPSGMFDLIVISDVLYYLAPDDIRRTAEACWKSLVPDGLVLLGNWRQPTGCPCSGDDAVKTFHATVADRCVRVTQSVTDLYRIDVLSASATEARPRTRWRGLVGRGAK